MAHKFDPKNKEKLKSKERRENLPPVKILQEAGLLADHHLIDIGCGVGYFSIAAAEIVTPKGKVYALDTSTEMLEFLTVELKASQIENVVVKESQEYGFPLKDGTGDMVLMSMVLHEVEDKQLFLEEAHRTLKSQGKIIIIEWDKKETEQGPPLKHRLDTQETKDYLIQAGFKNPEILKLQEVANIFYIITAKV